ncbi:MAG: autotransporter-associated beta strand repeat-containing protein [Pirellulales bacterium]
MNIKALPQEVRIRSEALTVNNALSGAGVVRSVFGTSGTTQLTFSSLTARSTGATVNFVTSGGVNGTSNRIVVTGQAAGFIGAGYFFGGSEFASYDAGGFVRAVNYGVDAGTSAVNVLGASTLAKLTSSQSGLGSTRLTALTISGATDVTFSSGANLVLTAGGILKTGGGASTISGGAAIIPLTADLVVRTDAAGDSLAISMPIQGPASLTKAGAGTLTLNAVGGFSGITRITEGSLVLGHSSALADSVLDLNAVDVGTLSLGSLTSVSLGGLSGTRALALGTTNLTVGNYGAAAAATIYTGTLSGSGTVTKIGVGAQIFGAANTGFTGTFNVDLGTLQARTSGNALGASGTDVTLNTGATLQLLTDTTGITFNNDVIVRGNSTINVDRISTGAGQTQTVLTLVMNNNTLAVSGGNTYSFQVSGNTTLAGPASTFSNPVTTPLITLGNATAGGKLTGSGALNKVGAGQLILSNSNTTTFNDYSGGTNVFNGLLTVNAASKLGTGSVYVAPGAQLRVNATSGFYSNQANTVLVPIAVTSASVATSNISQTPGTPLSTAPAAGYGALELATDLAIGTNANAVKSGPYGAAFRIAATIGAANSINMQNIGAQTAGNGFWFLGVRGSQSYSGSSLTPVGSVYRLGANDAAASVLTITAAALTGAGNSVVIGSPYQNVAAFSGGTGTVNYGGTAGAVMTYGGSTTVNKASFLTITSTANTQNLIPSGSQMNIFGSLQFSGTYNASAASPQQTFTNTVNIMNTGWTPAAGSTVGLLVSNAAYASSAIQPRLASTTSLYLSSGNFRYLGPTGAFTSTQALGTVTFEGGNAIEVSRGNATANNAVVTVSNAVRANNGTLTIVTTGGAFSAASGTDTKLTLTNINGAAPVVTNGMIAPWIIDHTTVASPSFVTSGATGLGPATYTTAATAAALQALTGGTAIADVTTALTLTANTTSVHALRVGNVAISGAFTINVGANATAADGAGVIFGSTAAQTHAANWVFGTAGNREAVIYNSTATFATTLSGTINATNLTKFGPGDLTLTGDSRGTSATAGILTGTITINQGALIAASPNSIGTRAGAFNGGSTTTPYVVEALAIRLAGGTLSLTGTTQPTSGYLNNVTLLNDSQITSVANVTPRFGSLTVAARPTGSNDATVLTIATGGTVFTGATTLTNSVYFNPTAAGVTNINVLEGQVTGAGRIDKWGVGSIVMMNGAGFAPAVSQNNYSGGTIINAGLVATTAGASADTPFGTGAVTVNAGGALRIAHANNVTGGITVNSDLTGLGAVAVGYNGALPTITFNNGNTGGPFSGVVGIDIVGYSTAINQNTLAGGTAFLGSVGGVNAASGVAASGSANFTGALTPSSTFIAAGSGFSSAPNVGGYYRLGGGGGVLNMNVANQLTGANNVIFGALNNSVQGNSIAMANGGGTVVLNQANNYSGITTINAGQTVQIGNDSAFGTSLLIFNGGTLQSDAYQRTNGFTGRTVTNAVKFAGDVGINSAFNATPADLTFSGSIGLSNSTVGGSMRTITVNTATYQQGGGSIITISGLISDGDSTYNGLNKAGLGTLRVTNNSNSYTGVTQILAGNLVFSNDAQLGTNPLVLMNGGTLSAWNSSFTTSKNLVFLAASSVDVSEGGTLTQNVSTVWQGSAAMQKVGSGTLILQGDNSFVGLTIAGGVVNASNNNQLGNISSGGITFSNTLIYNNTGGVPMLRFTADVPNVNRAITMTTAGAINVDAGLTVTFSVPTANSTGVLNKVGAGTLIFGGTAAAFSNLNDNTAVNAGILQTSAVSGTPFGDVAVTLNGGTIRLLAAADSTITMGTTGLSIGGGGVIRLDQTGAFNAQMTSANISRVNQGTMIISGTNLGGTSGQRSRLIASTNLLGVAAASAGFNGIVSPVIVRFANDGATSGDADFVNYDATNGFVGVAPASYVTSLSGSQVAAVANITTAQALTGTNSIYAFKTTADVSGGLLQIVANGSTGNQTQLGGILINGSGAAAPQISSDLFFGFVNNGVTQLNGVSYGEGVVYVAGGYSSGTATLGGAVTANSFTKFGAGTLLMSGANRISGNFVVQSGVVQFSGPQSQPASIILTLNDSGTLDLNGGTVKLGALASSGGIVTNSSATAATLLVVGNNSTTFAGAIQDGVGSTRLIKGGAGTLTLGGAVGSNPLANLNTFTGGVVLRAGQITLNNVFGLGGANGTTPGALELQGGTLLIQPTGVGSGLSTIIGNQSTAGVNVIVNGTSTTITTDNNGLGTGFQDNYYQFGNLTLGNSTFGATPSTDNESVRFAGTITGGNASVFNVGTAAGSAGRSVVDLTGIIQNNGSVPFAINKSGTGTLRVTSTSNTFSGGVNIMAGAVQVAATSGTPLGSGMVVVNPGGVLRLATTGVTTGTAGVRILSSVSALGVLALDGQFSPDNGSGAFTSRTMNSFLAGSVQLSVPTYSGTLNMNSIGDGNQFLGAYGANNLGNAGSQFVGTLVVGAGSRYRLGANSAATIALTFSGFDNTLSGATASKLVRRFQRSRSVPLRRRTVPAPSSFKIRTITAVVR